MDPVSVVTAVVWEDCGPTLLARVLGGDGEAIVQVDVASIGRKVFDMSVDPDTATDSADVAVANAVYDTLQTDARWTEDDDGYNFAQVLDGSLLSPAGHRLRIEYVFTPASGQKFPVVYELTTKRLQSS